MLEPQSDKTKKAEPKCSAFLIYTCMFNVKYDFSSVHVDVPISLAEEIVEWGRKQIKDEDIFVTQKDPTFGREDEIHITILYGLHNEKPEPVVEILENAGPITVKLGKVGVFTNPYKFDVVMINVDSPDLQRLNKVLHDNVKYTNKYGDYHPHVTIAYVKKGKGWKHLGLTHWEGREFTCNYSVFSSKDGSRKKISL